jgi:hypothetical protein
MRGFARKSVPSCCIFDAEFGTDTGRILYAEELRDSRSRRRVYNATHYGTAPSIFQQPLARLEIGFELYTFVDLRAGKGRIILLATNFTFRQIIGVEFSQELQKVACENISRNLEDSLQREPREIYSLYLKPDCAARLDGSPWLHSSGNAVWR